MKCRRINSKIVLHSWISCRLCLYGSYIDSFMLTHQPERERDKERERGEEEDVSMTSVRDGKSTSRSHVMSAMLFVTCTLNSIPMIY